MKIILLLISFVSISSCSFISKNLTLEDSLEIVSANVPVAIYASDGALLGTTPLLLKGREYDKNISGGVLMFEARTEKYKTAKYVLLIKGKTKIKIELEKYTQDEYEKSFVMNNKFKIEKILDDVIMFYEGMSSQNKVKLASASDRLNSLYPNISRIKFLTALASVKNGELLKARVLLDKALEQDPTNILASNLKSLLNNK